jgi:predicted enzyme related to lactoylglutathione lyase
MFKSIRALAIYVTNMGRAKKFYTEILGFKVSAEIEPNLCFLESESGNIHIYLQGGNKTTPIDRKTCRLSFFLQAEKSASETYALLKSAGVKLLQTAPELVGDNTSRFQFQDPDGNIIEIAGKS